MSTELPSAHDAEATANALLPLLSPWLLRNDLAALADHLPDFLEDAPETSADPRPETADQFEVTLVWTDPAPLLTGRRYEFIRGDRRVMGRITNIKYRLNPKTRTREAANRINRGEMAVCTLHLDSLVPFTAWLRQRSVGSLRVSDLETSRNSGAVFIHFALRRAHNIHFQHFDINMSARAAQKGQKPAVLWFTGLSGAGKSSIANAVERQLFALDRHSYLLDGDNVRHGLNRDLGFTDEDRVENIRRVAEVARLMADAGLIVLTAFISPFRAERKQAKQVIGAEHFFEIFVDTPLQVAEQRDVKGLYRKARSGQLKNFTGIDSPYQPPAAPDLVLSTEHQSPEETAGLVIEFMNKKGLI